MSPERYREIKSILDAALDLDPLEQDAYIDRVCGQDEELAAQVRTLIDHDRQADRFMERPALESAARSGFRLSGGERFGAYEIMEPIGAGAMGEVYRARDPRLGREVAIKLLPSAFASDPARLERFEREARTAGSLNHANVLTVHELGRDNGTPYIVAELLLGETLRARMRRSPIPPQTAIAWAAQIAHGVSAAHAVGIVHRDLKPENIFLARGGAVKILDFGLAKELNFAAEAAGISELGLVVGTPGYLAPEQAGAAVAGPGCDIFSLGVILFEMLTGRRPFAGASWVEELNSAATSEAPDLPSDLAGVNDVPALDRIVKRCLAKQPEERFESARDLAFALENIPQRVTPRPARSGLRPVGAAAVFVVLAVLAGTAFFAGTTLRGRPPIYQPLTLRRGIVSAARFAHNGNTVVYSTKWDDGNLAVFSTRSDRPEENSLQHPGRLLFSVSQEQIALCKPNVITQYRVIGTLEVAPLAVGGGALERADGHDVAAADWSPDGSKLAVVRVSSRGSVVEYPIGKVIYSCPSPGYIDVLRVSPDGKAVAFLEHPLEDDSAGWVAVVDAARVRRGPTRFNSMRGLAWAESGEVWFAAAQRGMNMGVWAFRPAGSRPERLVGGYPGYISMEDFSRGRALISSHTISQSMVRVDAAGNQKDFYWQDVSQVRDLSTDGNTVLFSESGNATQKDYVAYVRKADGSAPIFYGIGMPLSFCRRGVIANPAGPPAPLLLLGQGDPIQIAGDGIDHLGASWLPDEKRFVFAGVGPDKRIAYYVQSLEGGPPAAITRGDIHFERRSPVVVSPEGRQVAALGDDGRIQLFPTDPAEPADPVPVPGADDGVTPLQWCRDETLIVHRYGQGGLLKVKIRGGAPILWKQLRPPTSVGLLDVTPIRVSRDCRSYAFSPINVFSRVMLATGLR
jgi:eukaryotic-like serine/threonine-protein kinase